MAKIKLKPCPFCGEKLNAELDLFQYGKEKWTVIHYCHNYAHDFHGVSVSVSCNGATKEEAVERWNRRYDNAAD